MFEFIQRQEEGWFKSFVRTFTTQMSRSSSGPFDTMWEQGRVLELYPEQFGECCQWAQARQMIPGRGVKDTLAQAPLLLLFKVDLVSWSWVLRLMDYRVKCTQPAWAASQVTTQTWEHGTSDISSEWLVCVSVSRSSCQESQSWCPCHWLMRTTICIHESICNWTLVMIEHTTHLSRWEIIKKSSHSLQCQALDSL